MSSFILWLPFCKRGQCISSKFPSCPKVFKAAWLVLHEAWPPPELHRLGFKSCSILVFKHLNLRSYFEAIDFSHIYILISRN